MDREKVIKWLEILMNGCEYIQCEDCCFYISTKPFRCGLREKQIQEDALALLKEQERTINELQNAYGYLQKQFFEAQDKLLKEQEAVKPITERHLFLCPVCKNTLFREQKFCHECGKRIEWKGIKGDGC